MTDREAMQMALETAEQIACADYRHWEELASLSEFERWARSRANHIAEALRARLAQPEPEPVAWISHNAGLYHGKPDELLNPLPLYTAPPKKEWVGLTGEELQEIYQGGGTVHFKLAMAEAKLKEKNT
jgi:hypothetical protein